MNDSNIATKLPTSLYDLTYSELDMLSRYRKLNGKDREKIIRMIKDMITNKDAEENK